MKNWMSLSLNGRWAVSVTPLQYSTDRRREKNENQVRLMMEMFLGVGPCEEVPKA